MVINPTTPGPCHVCGELADELMVDHPDGDVRVCESCQQAMLREMWGDDLYQRISDEFAKMNARPSPFSRMLDRVRDRYRPSSAPVNPPDVRRDP